jgi:hypothetical protein
LLFSLFRGEIRLLDSLGFLALYFIYICVVIFGRMLYQRQKRRREAEDNLVNESTTSENENENENDDLDTLFVPRRQSHLLARKGYMDPSATTSSVDPATINITSQGQITCQLYELFAACLLPF